MNWSGFCDNSSMQESSPVSLFHDMSPSNATCISSTLKFLCEHAPRPAALPIIIFDQPLVEGSANHEPEGSDLNCIVLWLWSFHRWGSWSQLGISLMVLGCRKWWRLSLSKHCGTHDDIKGNCMWCVSKSSIDGVLNGLVLSDVFEVALPHHMKEKRNMWPLCSLEICPPPSPSVARIYTRMWC